ncbi:hypothetical protein FNV43_RR02103 [Rhamnella rubrinervis]|uniref:Uncharacterized protein n=1 Tax=Rhamnella rubrinervis TaxID=2594499 RepID=A0A8K0MTV0_9ROSA|nr:hypothetical protein FNV43_RR02103 [Rhamnella rubrinervis]
MERGPQKGPFSFSFRLKMAALIQMPGLGCRALEGIWCEPVDKGFKVSLLLILPLSGSPWRRRLILDTGSEEEEDEEDLTPLWSLFGGSALEAGFSGVRRGVPSMGGEEMSGDKAEPEDRAKEIEPSEQSDLGMRGEPEEEEEEVIGH